MPRPRTAVAVDRNQVMLDTPIKTVGIYDIKVALHPEVIVTVKINVARTADEAEAQAQGAVLTGPVSDRAEARAAAQALLEEEELPEGEERRVAPARGACHCRARPAIHDQELHCLAPAMIMDARNKRGHDNVGAFFAGIRGCAPVGSHPASDSRHFRWPSPA
jgi:hypothetical protein